jgi:hypothetical protein
MEYGFYKFYFWSFYSIIQNNSFFFWSLSLFDSTGTAKNSKHDALNPRLPQPTPEIPVPLPLSSSSRPPRRGSTSSPDSGDRRRPSLGTTASAARRAPPFGPRVHSLAASAHARGNAPLLNRPAMSQRTGDFPCYCDRLLTGLARNSSGTRRCGSHLNFSFLGRTDAIPNAIDSRSARV